MLALLGLGLVIVAFIRSVRGRFFFGAVVALAVGYGHLVATWASIATLLESGNPIAALAIPVLGRTALAYEGQSALVLGAFVGRFPIVASAVFALLSMVAWRTLEVRVKSLHPDTADAQRMTRLASAFLAVALVDGLFVGIGLLARALLDDGI